jgi:hypothetical protein
MVFTMIGKKNLMAIFGHLVGASAAGETLSFEAFEALVMALVHEKLVAFPAAIFVGEASDNPDGQYWSTDSAYDKLLPNSPGSMIALLEEYGGDASAVATLWYDGDDEAAFREALRSLPFGEKDICVCFDLYPKSIGNQSMYSRSGDGVVVYALARPFLVQYEARSRRVAAEAARKTLFQRDLAHYVVFYTSVGSHISDVKPTLQPLLTRYFGPDLLLEEAIEW